MDRSQLLEYMERQREKVGRKIFDLQAWKNSTINVLRSALGPANVYAQRIEEFDYMYKISNEELYPKEVVDMLKTRERLELLCEDIVDELRYLDPAEIGKTNAFYGRETLQALGKALRNQFSGHEIEELRILAASNKADKSEQLADRIKQMDVDKVQRLLATVLSGSEIWKELSG